MMAGNGQSHVGEWRVNRESGSKQTMAAYVIVEMEEKTLLETENSDKNCSVSEKTVNNTIDEWYIDDNSI